MSKETEITVIGNVVNAPQKNRTANGSVTNFRVASTAQRFDKELQRWVDKKPLFLDVECWGDLAGNVSHTLSKGDPVIVFGELFTDEWESDQGRRSKAKVRAEAVGLNLTWGVAEFSRSRRGAGSPGDEPRSAPTGPVDEGGPEADQADEAELLAGRDYIPAPETLDEMDSEAPFPVPALH